MVHDESDSPLPLPPGSSSVRRAPRGKQEQQAGGEIRAGPNGYDRSRARPAHLPARHGLNHSRACVVLGQVHVPEGQVQLIAMPHDRTARQRRNWSPQCLSPWWGCSQTSERRPLLALLNRDRRRAADEVESRSSNAGRTPGMSE